MRNFVRKYLGFIATVLVALLVILAVRVSENGGKLTSSEPTAIAPTDSASQPATTMDMAGYYSQQLTWTGCQDGFECTWLEVPLDYANPTASSIKISVIRMKGDHAQGSLILNPGGPGGSGIDYVRAIDYIMTKTLRDNFDIVGFDPRGVGQSTPVDCLDDQQTDAYLATDGTPDNQSEVDAAVSIYKQFADECLQKSPELMKFMDTVSAAKDVDILRAALGDEKLNWLGKSYGTFLGATYADLFPTKVGRMMLDGAIDPMLTNQDLGLGQAIGFDNALNRWVANCIKSADCPLKSGGSQGVKEVLDFLNKLDSHPGQLADGREFTQALAVTAVIGPLYDKVYGWPELRKSMTDAFNGDYEAMGQSVDFYTSRDQSGHFADNSNDAIMAVNCIDRPDRPSVADIEKLVPEWQKKAPVFGDYLAWGNLACLNWTAPATGTPKKITADGAPTILVVGTTNDPATPYPWAVALAKELASGVLLTMDGDGHTAYYQGSECIDKYVDHFYLTGQAPAGVTCKDAP